ncbi:twin-arginine translocation signal domain-containing protein [Streptomyces canus]|uniref:twin-arginine translocation signal domain-containing protein n=1 Tax=Streptomyces canus TaxID=58343 RepID=UPI0036BB98FB
MSYRVDRRQVLKVSLGAAAAAAAGTLAPQPAVAAAAHDDFPEVPGMSGDRRANEFWYQLDETTLYNAGQEVKDAYAAIKVHVGNIERGMREKWLELVAEPGYPHTYAEFMEPIRQPLEVLSRTQLGVMDRYYGRDHHRLVRAFGWFGEGVLYDPRGHAPFLVHTMNGTPDIPPPGYHTWYAYMRAMMLLDIDRRRWERLAPALSFAWALQSTGRPAQDKVNPPMPRRTVRRLAATWLVKDVRRLDQDFRSFPYPEGLS